MDFWVQVANPNLGEEKAVGGENGTVEKSVCDFHSNFSFTFTRFKDTAAFMLQHTTFPTPPLVSQKFRHVPLGIGGSP